MVEYLNIFKDILQKNQSSELKVFLKIERHF